MANSCSGWLLKKYTRVENYNVEKISYTKQTAEFTELAPESVNIKIWFYKGPVHEQTLNWNGALYY